IRAAARGRDRGARAAARYDARATHRDRSRSDTRPRGGGLGAARAALRAAGPRRSAPARAAAAAEGDRDPRAVKPAPFDYAAPGTVDEALSLLGEDAKALAGGQSLVPLLDFRLARPTLIVDVNGLAEPGTSRRARGPRRVG